MLLRKEGVKLTGDFLGGVDGDGDGIKVRVLGTPFRGFV
jgi:hypothetical protein